MLNDNYTDLGMAIVEGACRDYYRSLKTREKLLRKLDRTEKRIEEEREFIVNGSISQLLGIRGDDVVRRIDESFFNNEELFVNEKES